MAGRSLRSLKSALIATALMPALAWAGLTVLYDSGNTRALGPLLEVLEGSEAPRETVAPARPALGAADIERLLPIRSPGLTPGRVRPQVISRPLSRPFFLIGSDPLSRQWLAKHRVRLIEIGALGMLVQAETVDDLRTIARLAEGLAILPAAATDIAEALGITHYPVLISGQGIEQ